MGLPLGWPLPFACSGLRGRPTRRAREERERPRACARVTHPRQTQPVAPVSFFLGSSFHQLFVWLTFPKHSSRGPSMTTTPPRGGQLELFPPCVQRARASQGPATAAPTLITTGKPPAPATPRWRSRPTPTTAFAGAWVWRNGLRVRAASAMPASRLGTRVVAHRRATASRPATARANAEGASTRHHAPGPAVPIECGSIECVASCAADRKHEVLGVSLVATCFMLAALLL